MTVQMASRINQYFWRNSRIVCMSGRNAIPQTKPATKNQMHELLIKPQFRKDDSFRSVVSANLWLIIVNS
jgi:hypothetical protein